MGRECVLMKIICGTDNTMTIMRQTYNLSISYSAFEWIRVFVQASLVIFTLMLIVKNEPLLDLYDRPFGWSRFNMIMVMMVV